MTFHLYGFLLGIAIISVISCAEWVLKRNEQTKALAMLWPVISWMTIFGVIGARAYHVVTDWELYIHESFWEIFKIWNGGLGIFGAVFGAFVGLIAALWFQRALSMRNVFIFLDAMGFGWPLGQAIGRWGNYFNHELYGKSVSAHFPLGMHVPGEAGRFHPLFLYESMAMLCVWVGLYIWLRKTQFRMFGSGTVFGLVCIAYALLRIVLEPLRLTPNIGQYVGVFMLGIGLMMVYKGNNEQVAR